MGDAQGKCQDDSEIKIAMPSDPRDVIGPPVRGAIRPNRQVAPVSPPVVVTAENNVNPKRRKSVFALASPDADVLGQETNVAGRKTSQSKVAPGVSVYDSDFSQARRPSCVTQPLAVQVPGKTKKHSALSQLQLKQQCLENKILPLAKTITISFSSEKEILVFKELERVPKKESVGSFTDRSSPESNNSANMSITSNRSESSSSDAELLGPGRWRQRWCIDKVGREPGQIRCIKDLCMLRNGSIVASEPKNIRLQMFSKSGKSLVVLGPDSYNLRSSRSFGNLMSFRKTQLTGVVETVVDNLVAVTDLDRVLYIEAMHDGMLDKEVVLKGKTDLHGIATTRTSKIIVTEVGSKASVGMHETNGKFIREYKGNFRKPCYVAYDPIYDVSAVSDSEQGQVFLYDASGNLLNKFGASKNLTGNELSAGQLVHPSGLCWSSHGRLLVADEVQKKVVAFDLRNLTVETVLTAEDGLNRPVALATDFRDSKNKIYVAEELYNFGVNKYYLKMFEQRMTSSSSS